MWVLQAIYGALSRVRRRRGYAAVDAFLNDRLGTINFQMTVGALQREAI
jgi:hypothetical protein